MSFIRPEVAAGLTRWRVPLVGLALALLGLWSLTARGWLMDALGVALVLAGVALAWTASRRVLFQRDGDGVGVVQVIEGRIGYFGPFYGGTIALGDLSRIEIHAAKGSLYWHLSQPAEPPLVIPAAAKGADALFDAFLTLPGLGAARLLEAQRQAGPDTRLVWSRAQTEGGLRVLT